MVLYAFRAGFGGGGREGGERSGSVGTFSRILRAFSFPALATAARAWRGGGSVEEQGGDVGSPSGTRDIGGWKGQEVRRDILPTGSDQGLDRGRRGRTRGRVHRNMHICPFCVLGLLYDTMRGTGASLNLSPMASQILILGVE